MAAGALEERLPSRGLWSRRMQSLPESIGQRPRSKRKKYFDFSHLSTSYSLLHLPLAKPLPKGRKAGFWGLEEGRLLEHRAAQRRAGKLLLSLCVFCTQRMKIQSVKFIAKPPTSRTKLGTWWMKKQNKTKNLSNKQKNGQLHICYSGAKQW